MSIESLLLNIFGWFTLAEPDDCVATGVVTSIRHWIVLFCERYWLAGVGGRGWARSTKSCGKDIGDGGGFSVKIWNCRWGSPRAVFLIFLCSYLLESKLLVLRDLYLELVLCDLYLTKFDLTKDLLFDTFFIDVFTNSVVVITEFLNSNPFQYQWIGKLKKALKWNGPWTRFFLKTTRRRQDFFVKRLRHRQKLWKKMIIMGTLSSWCSM